MLCRAKNRIIAEYALRDIDKPIGVAELHLARLADVGLSRQRLLHVGVPVRASGWGTGWNELVCRLEWDGRSRQPILDRFGIAPTRGILGAVAVAMCRMLPIGPCVRGSRHPAVIPQELCRCRRRYSNKQADRRKRTVGGWQIVPSRALGLPRHVLTQHPVHS